MWCFDDLGSDCAARVERDDASKPRLLRGAITLLHVPSTFCPGRRALASRVAHMYDELAPG